MISALCIQRHIPSRFGEYLWRAALITGLVLSLNITAIPLSASFGQQQSLKQLENLLKRPGLSVGIRLQVQEKLASLYLQTGNFAKALPLLKEMHQRNLKAGRGITGTVMVHHALGLKQALVGLGQINEADDVLAEIQKKATRVHPLQAAELAVARAELSGAGKRSRRQQQELWDAARKQAEHGLQYCDRRIINNSTIRSRLVDCLVRACEGSGDFSRARKVLEAELRRLKSKPSEDTVYRFKQASLLQRLGAISRRAGKGGTARDYWEKAHSLASVRPRLTAILANVSDALAELSLHERNSEAAAEHWREAFQQFAIGLRYVPSQKDETARDGISPQWRMIARRRLVTLGPELGQLTLARRAAEELLNVSRNNFPQKHPLVLQSMKELALLEAAEGEFIQAYDRLLQVVEYWPRDQRRELASALAELATVEQAIGFVGDAQQHAEQALGLQNAALSEEDLDRVATHRVLARIQISQGQFYHAVTSYRAALRVCELAHKSEPDLVGRNKLQTLLAATLLDLSVVFKIQGQYAEALQHCQRAHQAHQEIFDQNHLSTADYKSALAALHRLLDEQDNAKELAQEAIQICRDQGHPHHTAAAAAHYQLGLIAMRARRWDVARSHWDQERAIYRLTDRPIQEARALNMLGVFEYHQGRFAQAEIIFQQALKLQEKYFAPPQELFRTECNLAGCLYQRKQTKQALELLKRAIAKGESLRTSVVGGEQERAQYFARLSSFFDPLVEWNVDDGNLADAVLALEQSRNRTFLDQIQLAGIDLRETIRSTHPQLLDQEQDLSRQVTTLRNQARAAFGRGESLDPLLKKLQQAQDHYAKVWKEIRNQSPYYRELLTRRQTVLPLSELRRSAIKPAELMLVYHLGGERSFVFAIEPDSGRPDDQVRATVYHLTTPEVVRLGIGPAEGQLVTRATSSLEVSPKEMPAEVFLPPPHPRRVPVPLPDHPRTKAHFPLSRSYAQTLVRAYLQRLTGETNQPTNQAAPQAADEKSAPLLADILLPAPLRDQIKRSDPKRLVIVPDGPLHQLPFEGLVTSIKQPGTFVLDEFPPITYAPSANIMVCLRDRLGDGAKGTPTLLSVGNPSYRETKIANSQHGQAAVNAFLALGGSLNRLPGTERECQSVTKAFAQWDTLLLLGDQATERKVVQSVAGRKFIHLAAHGLTDLSRGNLFGAIALTPAADRSQLQAGNDGFLMLAEIHALPLKDCELTVLSACKTNIGPARPLEASTSLAQGFLSAGSRRVVASLWDVEDASSAELMGTFFEAIAEARQRGEQVDYAAALQIARRRVRNHPRHVRWGSPRHWAPFVLIGPAEEN